jgi:hypothetical protein
MIITILIKKQYFPREPEIHNLFTIPEKDSSAGDIFYLNLLNYFAVNTKFYIFADPK